MDESVRKIYLSLANQTVEEVTSLWYEFVQEAHVQTMRIPRAPEYITWLNTFRILDK